LTIHLSNVVASPVQSAGDACTVRPFRHTDFSRSPSPVVSVDHFVMTGPATAPEPAPGLCAATLLLEDSKGVMQSLGSTKDDHEIRAGDLHWTQAGQGILRVHRPEAQARLHGLRIGIKLSDRQPAQPPGIALLRGWEMPVIQTDAGRIRVAAGSHSGWQSPLATPDPLMLLDAWLRPGATQLVPLAPGWNAWIYAVQGEVGVRARHRLTGAPALPKRPGGDPDFAVVHAGSALAASASVDDEHGVLVLMAGRAPVHFVLIAGGAIEAASGQPHAAAKPARRGLTQSETAFEAGDFGRLQPDLAA
jgi:redox-sensitive bicupin YhaK (pirin superfamily)